MPKYLTVTLNCHAMMTTQNSNAGMEEHVYGRIVVVTSTPVTAVVVSVCGELLFCVHVYLYGSLQTFRYLYIRINTFIVPDCIFVIDSI